MSSLLLSGELRPGQRVVVTVRDDELAFDISGAARTDAIARENR